MATAPLDVINIREINTSDIYDIYKIESSTYEYPLSLSIFRDCFDFIKSKLISDSKENKLIDWLTISLCWPVKIILIFTSELFLNSLITGANFMTSGLVPITTEIRGVFNIFIFLNLNVNL